MRTIKTRIFSCLLAVMLAIPAFSMSALAAGTDPEATESIPTTGGIEFDTPETDSSLSPEDTADTEDGASKRRYGKENRGQRGTPPPSSRSCWAS